ncbi:MAG: GNAT family N-acetyltransferase [Bacteroidia bacterium]
MAIKRRDLCEKYRIGHAKVLLDFGISNITSNNNYWFDNPNMYCVVIKERGSDELLGGIRIQIADGKTELPVEKAISKMDSKIHQIVSKFLLNGGIGELNGLWVDNRLRGWGIGPYLVRAAISTTNQLKFKTMIGICGENTMSMFRQVGFVVDDSVGKNGSFPYPSDDLKAHVVGILDSENLHTALEPDKSIMINLRLNPVQIINESTGNNLSTIHYNLIYPELN